jgi:hypothetical protein
LRFTPLLKGLELKTVFAKLIEVRECTAPGVVPKHKDHKTDRQVASWEVPVTNQHWHDAIEDTGQEGWVVEKKLQLPKKLRQCVQDVTHHGIKIRHKLRVVVGLKNPDGHISELRATLPVSIFISPNIPLDEEGNVVTQTGEGGAVLTLEDVIAPPGYGQHVLDQLYDDMVFGGFQTPENQSGTNSPYYHQSASASAEDLTTPPDPNSLAAVALAHRLQGVSMNQSRRNSAASVHSDEGRGDPGLVLSRQTTNQEATFSLSGRSSPESPEGALLEELNKVPSYATAVRTPARPRSYHGGAMLLPMYEDIEVEGDDATREATGASAESSDNDASPTDSSVPTSPTSFSGVVRSRAASLAENRGRPRSMMAQAPRPRTSRGGTFTGFSDALVRGLAGYNPLDYHPPASPRGYLQRQSMHCA